MLRIAGLAALIAACGGSATPTSMAGTPTGSDSASSAAATASGADANQSVAGDPAEPAQPDGPGECVFDRRVTCRPHTPTRTALQPSPFEWCARELPVARTPAYAGDALRFSAAETRKARRTGSAACCYVEFVMTACD
jgi:hypothetical protein